MVRRVRALQKQSPLLLTPFLNFWNACAPNKGLSAMLASEHILIDISLISYSPSLTNITGLWNIPSAFYLWSATVLGWSNTEYQHSRKPWALAATMDNLMTGKYVRQLLTADDRKILRNRYYSWLLFGSYSKTIVALLILLFSAIFIVVPFFPPRSGAHNWTLPSSVDDYVSRITSPWLIIPVIIVCFFILILVRAQIDLKVGTKKTGTFIISRILSFGNYQLIVLRGFRFVICKTDNVQKRKLHSGD